MKAATARLPDLWLHTSWRMSWAAAAAAAGLLPQTAKLRELVKVIEMHEEGHGHPGGPWPFLCIFLLCQTLQLTSTATARVLCLCCTPVL
jgi:hypothetical protein